MVRGDHSFHHLLLLVAFPQQGRRLLVRAHANAQNFVGQHRPTLLTQHAGYVGAPCWTLPLAIETKTSNSCQELVTTLNMVIKSTCYAALDVDQKCSEHLHGL